MFTYLNPRVRQKLIATGKLTRIDHQGRSLPVDSALPPGSVAIYLLGPIPLPLNLNGNSYTAQWYASVRGTELLRVEELASSLRQSHGETLFASLASPMTINSVLIIGEPENHANPLVRVHSNCLTGDVFGSQRCECGPQLVTAIDRIAADPAGGLVVYMAGHEGRGIGLWAKAATYLLQDEGENTYQANESLGLPTDSRDFTDAAALILRFLGNREFRLLTNNPKKIEDLKNAGLTQFTIDKHVTGVTEWNKGYLLAKRDWGHRIADQDLD